MSSFNNEKETLTSQICELEALQSVYPTELFIADHGTLADINSFIAGTNTKVPQKLEYSIKIPIPQGDVEVQVTLPLDYPKVKPEIYTTSSVMDRNEYTNFNEALKLFIDSQQEGEPCVYAIILWVQDNIEMYVKNLKVVSSKKNLSKEQDGVFEFTRYWVYSHHIYSKLKRKSIQNIAKENSLTGFCLAGKPGIVCVEGASDDCEYWWQQVKAMNWHRILIKLVENDSPDNINKSRNFVGFEEIMFPTSDRHNDMGRLLKYLTDHKSQHVFKEIFGVEGKSAE